MQNYANLCKVSLEILLFAYLSLEIEAKNNEILHLFHNLFGKEVTSVRTKRLDSQVVWCKTGMDQLK